MLRVLSLMIPVHFLHYKRMYYKRREKNQTTLSDKIDQIVTNRFLALPIFAMVMFVVYYVSVNNRGWATDWANDGVFGDGFSFLGLFFVPGVPVLMEGLLTMLGTADWLSSLVLDGIVSGVGAVLGFVPIDADSFHFSGVSGSVWLYGTYCFYHGQSIS